MASAARLAAVAVPYVALEAAWFSWAVPRMYGPLFARVQGRGAWAPRAFPQLAAAAAAAYALLTWGVARFALPADSREATDGEAAAAGASLGFLVYGAYNLTNYVAFDGWGALPSAVDTAWGALAMAAVCVVARRALAWAGRP